MVYILFVSLLINSGLQFRFHNRCYFQYEFKQFRLNYLEMFFRIIYKRHYESSMPKKS